MRPEDEIAALREELEGNGMENKGLRRYYAEAKELAGIWKQRSDALREELEATRQDLRRAADANKAWMAENTRLREALEVIAGQRDPYVPDEELAAFARTALEPTKEEHEEADRDHAGSRIVERGNYG